MEDTNSFQNLYRGNSKSNPIVREMKDEIGIIVNRVINEWVQNSKDKLDKLWEMAILHEERQNAINRNNSRSGETSEVIVKYPEDSPSITSTETTISSVTSTADISSNQLQSATTTGSFSHITPNLPSSVANTNLTFDFNNNDDTEFLTYEEEAYDSIFYDELLLSNEDQAFVDSIQNPTFSGIVYLHLLIIHHYRFPLFQVWMNQLLYLRT